MLLGFSPSWGSAEAQQRKSYISPIQLDRPLGSTPQESIENGAIYPRNFPALLREILSEPRGERNP